MFQFQSGAIKRRCRSSQPVAPTCVSIPISCDHELAHLKQNPVRYACFNSNLVRLREGGSWTFVDEETSFNSNLVRLRAAFNTRSTTTATCFNSNLVRLRVNVFPIHHLQLHVFQFQSGAIKRQHDSAIVLRHPGFNSNLVRLREARKSRRNWPRSCFNSNLVRLRVKWRGNTSGQTNMFQFQSGAIKSHQTGECNATANLFQFQSGAIKRPRSTSIYPMSMLFQFQSGAIKRKRHSVYVGYFTHVSIPIWCD